MRKKCISKAQKSKERSSKKVCSVVKKKGHKSGKLPKGKVLHHVKTIADRGKTTLRNTRVVSQGKHKKIHKNRKKRGKI